MSGRAPNLTGAPPHIRPSSLRSLTFQTGQNRRERRNFGRCWVSEHPAGGLLRQRAEAFPGQKDTKMPFDSPRGVFSQSIRHYNVRMGCVPIPMGGLGRAQAPIGTEIWSSRSSKMAPGTKLGGNGSKKAQKGPKPVPNPVSVRRPPRSNCPIGFT